MTSDFAGSVAVVSGAGGGLGRSHALQLARRGARVVVNDLSGPTGSEPTDAVVAQISAAGGSAIAEHADITDYSQVTATIDRTLDTWGRVDILVTNAGILRDATFRNSDLDDFRRVMDVHLMRSARCTKALWDSMIHQRYGRVLMTTSGSGMYGNFGQGKR
ncbi:SDR family NAD(P)-dependent oxidoreductase [Nocardia nova]|uniref:SDR family NAD(P)-dependent oxidoreductase n=1 Tax=Nocardia nova TaxID=37330 RepID=UPI0037ABC9D4